MSRMISPSLPCLTPCTWRRKDPWGLPADRRAGDQRRGRCAGWLLMHFATVSACAARGRIPGLTEAGLTPRRSSNHLCSCMQSKPTEHARILMSHLKAICCICTLVGGKVDLWLRAHLDGDSWCMLQAQRQLAPGANSPGELQSLSNQLLSPDTLRQHAAASLSMSQQQPSPQQGAGSMLQAGDLQGLPAMFQTPQQPQGHQQRVPDGLLLQPQLPERQPGEAGGFQQASPDREQALSGPRQGGLPAFIQEPTQLQAQRQLPVFFQEQPRLAAGQPPPPRQQLPEFFCTGRPPQQAVAGPQLGRPAPPGFQQPLQFQQPPPPPPSQQQAAGVQAQPSPLKQVSRLGVSCQCTRPGTQ